ncbi:MAG: Asp-tRNA(Asn)/Glu-tRNA(Gln) amidotransferase subunit GatB [bacterium]|nr:Asp-tRNA(Asn)/Glu-tRNA(Gln) amidotransferase subunit GatB [bacterium]
MSKYIPTIGLEIHAELKTKTKMFCDSLNDPFEKHPNTNVCPVCLGHPGTLPVMNRSAVEAVLKVGMALNGEIPQFSKFDRKNYFYPDLPKAYQISQYDLPLIFGGILDGIRLRRIHLEEDTARLLHQLPDNLEVTSLKAAPAGRQVKASYVDYNRAGVPLMELVTEPDIKNADQAVEFAKALQLILRYLEVSDADMERGQMRVEANISIHSRDDESLGTKVEVKNINSFRAVHDAIEYELQRQQEALEKGETIKQETRGWDENKKKTVSQRSKEEAHDYRYFPETDLPPLDLSSFALGELKNSLPELPKEKRARLIIEYDLQPEQAVVLVADKKVVEYFENAVSELKTFIPNAGPRNFQTLFNYLTNDVFGLMAERGTSISELKLTPENFAELVAMVITEKVSSRAAKDILPKILESGEDPHELVKAEGLAQVSNEDDLTLVAKIILERYPKVVADYKKGKSNALQFMVGKAMAELRGSGNPEILQKVFKRILDSV